MNVLFIVAMFFVNIIAILIANYVWAAYSSHKWRWNLPFQEIQNFFKNNLIGIISLSILLNVTSSYIFNYFQQDNGSKENKDQSMPIPPSANLPKEVPSTPPSPEPKINNLIIAAEATPKPTLQTSPPISTQQQKIPLHPTVSNNTMIPSKSTKQLEENLHQTSLKNTSCRNVKQITILFDEKITVTEPVSNIKNYIESQLKSHCYSVTEDKSHPELIFYIKNNDYANNQSPTSGIYRVKLTINAKGLHENYSGYGEKESQSQQEANDAALKQAAEDIVDKISKQL